MSDLTLVALEFDESVGPAIRLTDGSLTFSPSVRRSIECSSFPESVAKIRDQSHLYSFVVSSFYCHCAYIQK
jgi:hypothetical protein